MIFNFVYIILGLSDYDFFSITVIDGKESRFSIISQLWYTKKSFCIIQYRTMIKLLKFTKRSCWVTIVNYSLNKLEDTCRITIVWLVLFMNFKFSAKNTDIYISGRRQDLLLFTIIMTSSTIRFISGLSLVQLLSVCFVQHFSSISNISEVIRT